MSRRLSSAEDRVAVLVMATLVLTALAFWRGLGEPFQLLKMSIGFALALGAAAAWVVTSFRRDRLVLPPPSVLVAVGGFVVALVLAVVLSSTPMVSVVGTYTVRGGLLTYGGAVLVMVVAAAVFDETRARTFLVVVVVAAGAAVAYMLLQALDADPFTWLRESKVFGTFGNDDFASGWVGIALPLVVGAALVSPGGWRRIAAIVVAVGSIVALPLTNSFQGLPTATVGLLVLGAAWLLSSPERRTTVSPLISSTRRRIALAAGGLVVLAGVLVVSWAELRHGMLERRYFWRAALDVAGRHPVFGSGLDTFAGEFFRARPAGHAIRFPASSAEAPHDVPLAMLANGGVVLLLAYFAVVVTVGAAFVHGLRRSDGARRILVGSFAGAWLAYQIQSLVSIDVPALAYLHWIVAGIGVAVAAPELRLVWLGARAANVKGRGPAVVRSAVPTVVLALVVVAAGAVFAARPVLADRHAVRAVEMSRTRGADPVRVIHELVAATDMAPWEPTYQLALASLYTKVGNPGLAAKAATEAARLDPGRPQYHLAAGDLLASVGSKGQAVAQYRTALRIDPENAQVLERAGRGLLALGESERALPALEHLVKLVPTSAQGWYDLGEALDDLGHEDEARSAKRRAQALDPTLAAS